VGELGAGTLTLGQDGTDPALQLFALIEGSDRSSLGQRVDGERHQALVHRLDHVRAGQREPHPQGGQPVGLREGAQHHDVGVGVEQRRTRHQVTAPCELVVGLVDDEEGSRGELVRQATEVVPSYCRARRVIGLGEKHEPGGFAGGGKDPVCVNGLARERHSPGSPVGELGEDGVGLERRVAEDDLVARADVGRH